MDANRAFHVCRIAIELFGYPDDALQIEVVPSSTAKS